MRVNAFSADEENRPEMDCWSLWRMMKMMMYWREVEVSVTDEPLELWFQEVRGKVSVLLLSMFDP